MHSWTNTDDGLSVHLLKKHKKKLDNFCNKYFPNECGGILLGNYDKLLKKAYIKSIFFSKENVGSRNTVIIEAKKVNIILRTLWKFTLGNCYFIGTWHSHPNGAAIPSQTDDETMIKIAKTNNCNCSRPILIILGGSKANGWIADNVWVYTKEGERIELKFKTQ